MSSVNPYAVPAIAIAVLCIASCLTFVLVSGMLEEEEEPMFVIVGCEGTVEYSSYDESSVEEIEEFAFSVNGTVRTITLFIREGIPAGYSYVGNSEVDGQSARIYSSDDVSVHIGSQGILRIDATIDGSQVSAYRIRCP